MEFAAEFENMRAGVREALQSSGLRARKMFDAKMDSGLHVLFDYLDQNHDGVLQFEVPLSPFFCPLHSESHLGISSNAHECMGCHVQALCIIRVSSC